MSQIQAIRVVRLNGMLDNKNASAITFWKGQALVVVDELTDAGNVVQAFVPEGDHFRASGSGVTVLDVPGQPVKEMDLEGLAVDGQTVYVLGSHSAKRKKIDVGKKYSKNRAALMSVPEAQSDRDVLLRFDLDASGKAGPIERTNLRSVLTTTEPFLSYQHNASKENGVDTEGLAVWNQKLYIGFRGPVLRGNFTPILRCRFGSPITEPEVLFVNLGGRGVRDLAKVESGLLILAGPVGDGPGSYQLYLWDGRDGVPGIDAPTSATSPGIRLIGDLPLPVANTALGDSAKPEGLAVIEETANHWELLVVFDGLADGHATRYRVMKPQGAPNPIIA